MERQPPDCLGVDPALRLRRTAVAAAETGRDERERAEGGQSGRSGQLVRAAEPLAPQLEAERQCEADTERTKGGREQRQTNPSAIRLLGSLRDVKHAGGRPDHSLLLARPLIAREDILVDLPGALRAGLELAKLDLVVHAQSERLLGSTQLLPQPVGFGFRGLEGALQLAADPRLLGPDARSNAGPIREDGLHLGMTVTDIGTELGDVAGDH